VGEPDRGQPAAHHADLRPGPGQLGQVGRDGVGGRGDLGVLCGYPTGGITPRSHRLEQGTGLALLTTPPAAATQALAGRAAGNLALCRMSRSGTWLRFRAHGEQRDFLKLLRSTSHERLCFMTWRIAVSAPPAAAADRLQW
jgi:hypothetical protein